MSRKGLLPSENLSLKMTATEYPPVLMICAPANPTTESTITKLYSFIQEYGTIFPFSIPEFRVGTLDSLVILSDDLLKTDSFVTNVVLKTAETLKTLLGNESQFKEMLLVSESTFD